MKLLRAPASKFEDNFEQERFNFTWWLFMVLASVFVCLSVLHFFRDDLNFYIAALALATAVISMGIMYFTRSHIIAALVGIIAGSLINQIDLFVVVSSQKFVTTLWILCIALSAYYLIGTKAGFITLVLNLIGVAAALYVVPKPIQISRIVERSEYGLISISINLFVITFVISFLMYQILKSSKQAEQNSKRAQEELTGQYKIVQAQNEEKTVMLKEIHHRVKNNLQVITSLLRLQSREIQDKKSIEYFHEAIQRVLAMALIHEKMYQSEELARIDLKAYLRSLSEELIASYSVQKPIDLDIECEIEYIQPKSVVSFALMFNELISNSLKHAFVNLDKGEIKIAITHPEKNQVIATYWDNGTWLPQQKVGSFGLELIDDLCEQLDGTFERISENGTKYTFTFEYLSLD
ncbi:MAG: histidine kinase dimerization/phosphoacceptor domain -containing protein [Crocinitomicaceae bacterium]